MQLRLPLLLAARRRLHPLRARVARRLRGGAEFAHWIVDVCDGDPEHIQVLYGGGGETRIDEYALPHLEGYCRSRPVRISHAAHGQRQLDICSEVLNSAYLLCRAKERNARPLWAFLRAGADLVCRD